MTTSLELTSFKFILHSGLCAILIHKPARKSSNIAKTIASSIALAVLMIYIIDKRLCGEDLAT